MSYPLIQDCVLIIIGDTVAFEVTGNAIIANCLTDATTTIDVNAGGVAYVLGDEGNTTSGAGSVEPLASDRAAWDALNYAARHTNDADDSATSIHHTLGTGADQAAAGNHSHVIAPGSISLTNTHILVGNGSNVAADVAMSADATLANTGALTLATVNSNVGTFGSATQVAQVTVNGKGLVTAASNVSITAGHTIQDEGTPLTTRANLNFVGTGVTATDDSGNNATVVTIPNTAPINVYNETQTADGVSLTYYLTNYAAPSTIRVYIDGIRQPASDDTDPTDIVTFSVAPALNALLMFDYEMDQA